MNVAGIDPSLACTGVAAVRPGSSDWWTTRVRTSPVPGAGLDGELRRIQVAAARTVRALPPGVRLVAIEMPLQRSVDKSHNDRVLVYGLIVMKLREMGVEVARVNPTTRAKYATGNGNAGKPAVLAAVRERFGRHLVPDHNVADAVALAAMAARSVGGAVDGLLSPKQEEAFAAVAWPGIEGDEG